MRLPVETLIATYHQNLYRAAFAYLKHAADAQDALQETWIKYLRLQIEYESEEHIRSWLFRTVINQAKDMRRSFFISRRIPMESCMEQMTFDQPGDSDIFLAVMQLPDAYRSVIHMFYYENFKIGEIADILHLRPDTVKKRLERGRKKLKETLREEYEDL